MSFKYNLKGLVRKFGYQASVLFFLLIGFLGVFTVKEFQNSVIWIEHSYQVVANI